MNALKCSSSHSDRQLVSTVDQINGVVTLSTLNTMSTMYYILIFTNKLLEYQCVYCVRMWLRQSDPQKSA